MKNTVIFLCLLRHSHIDVYSSTLCIAAVCFYSSVPVLQSKDCLSRGSVLITGADGPLPCFWAPVLWDKWGLFLPSHALWLMLNPFGLIILIAAPAIKTTDAFVQA